MLHTWTDIRTSKIVEQKVDNGRSVVFDRKRRRRQSVFVFEHRQRRMELFVVDFGQSFQTIESVESGGLVKRGPAFRVRRAKVEVFRQQSLNFVGTTEPKQVKSKFE